jgi:beta-lactamase regulating signal transducer with metallopeptidase domain
MDSPDDRVACRLSRRAVRDATDGSRAEIAHIRRGDLLWEIVPFLLRTVFWFLPPAHYTADEIGSAREEACDVVAIRACGSSPSVYGSLLIRVASVHSLETYMRRAVQRTR